MSLKQLQDLKQRTLVVENTLKSLKQSFNHLKTQVSKTDEDTKEEEKSVVISNNYYIFLDNNIKLSLKNGISQFFLHKGTFHPLIFSKPGLEWCHNNFEPNENDIFVQTFPKCGTTLTLQILYHILSKSGVKVLGTHPELFPDPINSVLWLGYNASQDLYKYGNNDRLLNILDNNNPNTIRLWKTHCNLTSFPCKNGKYSGKCKIIHVTRNPKDVIQSGYNFYTKTRLYSGDFDSYFEYFINGLTLYNDLFKYEMDTIKMIKKYGKDKILFLYYENIILNPINEINKIIKFLKITNLTEKDIKQIKQIISFDKMKEKQKIVEQKGNITIANLNKGKIGSWKNVLSNKQSEMIDTIIKQRIEPFNKELSEEMKIKWYFG